MRRHLHPLVCASLLACAVPTLAADIGSASIGVNNLTIRLIDLDANDGITPGITWTNGATIDASLTTHIPPSIDDEIYPVLNADYYITQRTGSLTVPFAAPGSWQPFSFSSSDSRQALTISPDSLSMKATLNADQLGTTTAKSKGVSSLGNGQMALYQWTYTYTMGGSQISFDAAAPGYITTPFSLTPNTSMVVEGAISSTLSVDTSFLRSYLSDHPDVPMSPTGENVRMARTTASQVFAASNARLWVMPEGGEAQRFYFSSEVTMDPSAWVDNVDIYTSTETQAFSYIVNNTDRNKSLKVHLNFSGNASVNQTIITHDFFETRAAVPEPATYALMGLGLVGMALVRRRA